MAPGVLEITSNKRRLLIYKENGDFVVDGEALSFESDPYHESTADHDDTRRDGTPAPQFIRQGLLRITMSSKPKDAHLGWIFGSYCLACDVLLDENSRRGISAKQFAVRMQKEPGVFLIVNLSRHGTLMRSTDPALTLVKSQRAFGASVGMRDMTLRVGDLALELTCPKNSAHPGEFEAHWSRLYAELGAQVPPMTGLATPTSRFVYQLIEEVERLEYYQSGGYHPVQIGDSLQGRYRIVHKLGHGSFSTTWLARDQQLATYVAIKVATSDSDHHEADVLSRITVPTLECKGRGKPLLPAVLDRFSLCGPNGTHFCLVTNPARFARALPAQLAIAVARVHDQKYVHGDLHLGNILLHLPSGLNHLSEEQLYHKFGPPEPEPIIRLDGKPISPNIPSHAISPLLLVDFGVAFRPSEESRFQSYTPLEIRPPEARFEPTTPLSFASDIWSLACTIWAIIGQRSLFDSLLATEDDITCEHVEALGCLPPEWLEKWGARPSDRPTARQVLETAWMRDWALPEFEKIPE
ncbi:kinase [Hirsutella rhossiliensis]|uniref:non-specific serine/threonine protein kinase n=1 Tax=Hirsutella rhossiliensis TaxID=111463 RepID=A0A9P8MWK4_9HYPO|nr:kinase [Hirsutella rhossiliensis]KAH0963418.1 kinase [Hirsutella rhossiliensis]